MIYTKMTETAMKIAYAAHKDQMDKGGVPYVFHPYHLAEQRRPAYRGKNTSILPTGVTISYGGMKR